MRFRANAAFLCFAVALSILAILVGTGFWISSFAYRAEHALQATCLASVATEAYIRDRKTWPTSWKELESVSVTYGTQASWPRDKAMVQAYVEIDFDRTLDEISRQSEEVFDAIKPKVPTYGSYRNTLAWLLEAVKDVRTQENTKARKRYSSQERGVRDRAVTNSDKPEAVTIKQPR